MKPFFPAKDEISSTAKLLGIIRGEGSSSPSSMEPLSIPAPTRTQAVQDFFQHLPVLRKRLVVGIEFSSGHITLVKMRPLSPTRHQLLAYRRVPFAPDTEEGTPSFCDFLHAVVMDFAGPLHKVSLWTGLASGHGDLRQIRIPRKAARGKLAQAVYWVARKELNFKEAEAFFDFEVQGKVTKDRDGKLWVMAYTAPRDAVTERKELFTRSGLELEGLTITPFIIQNLFRSRWVPTSSTSTYADLQLGAAASRISIFFGDNLILTKAIEPGSDSLSFSPELSPDGEEFPPEMVNPALAKLTGDIEALFQYHCGPGKGEPIQKLFISGPVIPGEPVLNHLSQQLAVTIVAVDLLNPANPFLSRVRPPPSLPERALYTSALGLALSAGSRTPNLLCSFAQKNQQAAAARLNRLLLWGFVMILLLLGGFFLWQDYGRQQKHAELSRLRDELAHFAPVAHPEPVTQQASKVTARLRLLKSKAEKYLSLAVLGELSSLTPDGIRLLSITADFGGLPQTATGEVGLGPIKSVSRSLVIEGLVEGDSLTAEAALAHYLMRLGASPLFVEPTVHQSSLEVHQDVGEVLHFFLRMGLG